MHAIFKLSALSEVPLLYGGIPVTEEKWRLLWRHFLFNASRPALR